MIEEANLEIQNFSRCHIHAIIKPLNGGAPWKMIGFYGHPEAHKRHEAWDLLRHLASFEPEPWVCLGDFNEILRADEKRGGAVRAGGLMDAFQSTLDFCAFTDLGARGPKFT
jgi:endonuclease/exonuclease/phosphatase family metal-dependent hydrolase